MRTYDVAVTSLAIGAPLKWTDNLLAQHSIDGVTSRERGVTRKISYPAMLVLAVVRELNVAVGLSVRDAVALAPRLLGESGPGVPASEHLRVVLDRAALERAVGVRLREALESAPAPRRGRPPSRRRVGEAG